MKLRQKLACLAMGVCCSIMLIPVYLKVVKESGNSNDMIYITAAHIPHEDVVGYTFMYEDKDRDTAYYIKEDYTYHYPAVGEEVYYIDSKGTVESIVDGVGFYVKPSNEVYKGMSGARVKNKQGDTIAFISSMKGDNRLLCISTY